MGHASGRNRRAAAHRRTPRARATRAGHRTARRILYTEHQDDLAALSHRLWIVDVEGGAPRPLTRASDPGVWSEGDWSPDGRTIVAKYWRPGWDHNELRLLNADGTDARTLWVSPSGHSAETPDWDD